LKNQNKGTRYDIDGFDPIAEARIDEALNGTDQQFIAQAIKHMPSEEPSLVWRSALNEKVRELAVAKKKTAARWAILRPAMGLGLAATLAVMFLKPMGIESEPRSTIAQQAGIESLMADAHLDAERGYDLGAVTLVVSGAESNRTNMNAQPTWDEFDLGAL
jgi:hypothetical protein